MPIIPSGNISLLELIEFAFEQKYGNATVDLLDDDEVLDVSYQWAAVSDAISKAFKAHDIMFYVESLDGTEKRLTYQQSNEDSNEDSDEDSDEDLVWRTLLTGKLEHEPDPAVFQRTVYVRVDDASTFLKEFTGTPLPIKKEVEQPDPATGGADEGKAAELPGLKQDERRPHDKQQRIHDVQAEALLGNRIKAVIAKAKAKWPDPGSRPGAKEMARRLVVGQPKSKVEDFGQEAIRKILAGIYKPAKDRGIPGLGSR